MMDKVRSFVELPGQVGQLKEQYDETKRQLDEAASRMEEVSRQSQETIERYRAEQMRLIEENEMLAAQNERLVQSVATLEQAERERAAQSRRTWTVIWSAAALAALYLVSGRLFRLLLRNRHT